jgi:nucleotide-binding universal stress UspA family protein
VTGRSEADQQGQAVFGGVTETVLGKMTLPVLLSN